jgi:predicted O-linked N-acetylglucosamine transferase (SPINDLY family)
MATIPEALTLALQHHQAGRLREAEAIYRQILQVAPNHPDALHLLGVTAHQEGHPDVAVCYIQQALALNPQEARYHNNLGEAYRAQGSLTAAIAHYRQALGLRPDYAEAAYNLGIAYQQQGRLAEAAAHYGQALALQPALAEAHNNLGTALAGLGKLDEAMAHYRQALALRPNYAEAHFNLGNALKEEGQFEAAAAAYRQAVALNPGYAEALHNLAVVLQQLEHWPEAVAAYQEALTLNPTLAGVHFNLGVGWQRQGHVNQAITHYRQALTLRPDSAVAHNLLGTALYSEGRLEEAVAHYRKALAIKPDYADVYHNLANVLKDQGLFGEAIAHYRQVLVLRPGDPESENHLMHELQHLCEWSGLEDLFARQRASIRTYPSARVRPFTLVAIPSSPEEQLLCAKNWVANCFAPLMRLRSKLGFNFLRAAKPRLRLGYLSADFRQHVIAHLIAELFELHDRARFDVFAYSFGPDDGSALRQRLIQAFDRFTDISPLSYEEAARRIYSDAVDILIDLQGYTSLSRSQIGALRPAPIQVNYLGYPGTLGAEFMDYIITDRFTTPPEQQAYFAERFVYLPHCYQINSRQRPIAERIPSRTECGLPPDGFVFCCFNGSYKITPAIFDIWMRLLQGIPGSVLWLLESSPGVAANLCREAARRGVQAGRLIIAPRLPLKQHLARLPLSDLFLDTSPVNGGATASDALWVGVPYLTCAGETMVSRVAGSLLTAIGLPELVTPSLAEYEARALHLAQHPEELASLRDRLAQNRLTAPLFDTPRFTRHLEAAYQTMWEIFRRGEPPRQIEVPPLEARTGDTGTRSTGDANERS